MSQRDGRLILSREAPDPWVLCAVGGFNPGILQPPIPLLGPPHIDYGFPQEWLHQHIDWRRTPEDQYQAAANQHTEQTLGPVGEANLCWLTIGADGLICEMRYMPVIRPHPPCNFAQPRTPHEFYRAFEQRYAGQKLDSCQRCPHQGISVDGARLDRDGRRQCPGHGLGFNTRGVCVPRFKGG